MKKMLILTAAISAVAATAQASSLAPRTSPVPPPRPAFLNSLAPRTSPVPPWIIYTAKDGCYVIDRHGQSAQIAGDCH